MSDLEEQCSGSAGAKRLASYTCPGESYSISHSIHLARLAAFYSKCHDCEHRFDAEHIFPRESARHPVVEQRVSRTSLITNDSVRGVYLNELDRNRAITWGEAFAAVLWDQHPLLASTPPTDEAQIVDGPAVKPPPASMSGPRVVVGFDERPSSPDIISGVVAGLRRMGCHVDDLGQTSLPILVHTLQSMNASAGLYVTGAGGDPSQTGMEFLLGGGIPVSRELLERMELERKTGVPRQTREIGRHQGIQGQAAYEAHLLPYFHALRPLRIVCGSATRLMPRVLDRVFSQLPCRLTHLPLSHRVRNLLDPRDADLQRVAKQVLEGHYHLGALFDEDAQYVAFVTDGGRLVTPREVARLVMEIIQRDNHAAKFVVATSLIQDATQWLAGREATAVEAGETTEGLVRTLHHLPAQVGFATDGRIWFQAEHPCCDALLVLSSILQVLSLSDAPFSEVVTRIGLPLNGTA